MNRFVFIVTFRNNKKYIRECAESLLSQKYNNWIAIFGDDASTDGTIDEIPNDERFIIKVNDGERLGTLMNVHKCITESNLNDNDIICILDGDDKLCKDNSIDILNKLYNDDTLLTYGQYITSRGHIGHCRAYTRESFKRLRQLGFWASHMRTFKYKVYKELIKQDPNLDCYKDENGDWYMAACDVAKITPLMEIAGFDRIKFNSEPIYYYRMHENNHKNVSIQKKMADHAFSKKPFKKLKERKEGYSILIASYKMVDYIEECLDSVEAQTYFKENNNYEILVGVDGCEETLEKIKEITHKYRNLKVFYMEENKGMYITTNTLLTKCIYDKVICFGSDDIMKPDMIKKISKHIDKCDYLKFACSNFINNDTKKIIKKYIPDGVSCNTWKVHEKLGGYKPWRTTADTDFLLRRRGFFKEGVINESLFYRRIHDKSLTQNSETGHGSELRKSYNRQLKHSYRNIEYVKPVVNNYVLLV